jgi:hypothetical protein
VKTYTWPAVSPLLNVMLLIPVYIQIDGVFLTKNRARGKPVLLQAVPKYRPQMHVLKDELCCRRSV